MRVLALCLLAGALLVAGCVAPTASEQSPTATPASTPAGETQTTASTPAEATPTATDSEPTTPNGSTGETAESSAGPPTMASVYGIDQNQTLYRVERLLDVNVMTPNVTVSQRRIDRTEATYRTSLGSDPFLAAFGLNRSTGGPNGTIRIAGFVVGARSVVMNPNLTVAQAESTLAHEYVHVAQFQQDWQLEYNDTPIGAYRARYSRELSQIRSLVQEGTAEYLQYEYGARHIQPNESVAARLAETESFYWNRSGATQLAWTPYAVGARFVADRVEEPTEIPDLYDRAPTTTEQVLHGETQATEPPLPMTVDIDAPTVRWQGSQGELFTRIALAQQLNRSQATAAAAGWGNDTMAYVERDDSTGYVWVSRWDTVGDAGEFERAMERFTRARERTTPAFRTVRASEDTVVVVLGDQAVVDAATVTAGEGTVGVEIAETQGR